MTQIDDTMYEIALFYKNKNQAVHIWMKDALPNGKRKYRRGFIIAVNEDFHDRLVLQEEDYGQMLIFFERIDEILPREKKKEVDV